MFLKKVSRSLPLEEVLMDRCVKQTQNVDPRGPEFGSSVKPESKWTFFVTNVLHLIIQLTYFFKAKPRFFLPNITVLLPKFNRVEV